MMRFKAKNGEIFETIEAALAAFTCPGPCNPGYCPLYSEGWTYAKSKSHPICKDYVITFPDKAARLMDYEVIKDVPDINVGDKTKVLYRKNIEARGKATQILKLFEEMAELQEAICKCEDDRDDAIHIAEEIADVQIMLEQMIIIYKNEEFVESWRKGKLERMARSLLEGEKE